MKIVFLSEKKNTDVWGENVFFLWLQYVEFTSKRFKKNSTIRYFQTSTKNFSVKKLKVLAPFMGHLGYSGFAFNAICCHFVILESILYHFYDYVFLRLQTFEILPCANILLFLFDNFDFTMYIHYRFFQLV